jgi:hypothetical protein
MHGILYADPVGLRARLSEFGLRFAANQPARS